MLKDHSLERFHSKRSLFLNTYSFSLLTNQHIYKHEKKKNNNVLLQVFQKELKPLDIVQVTLIVSPAAQQAAQMLIVST